MEKLSKFKDLSNNEVLNFKELSIIFGSIDDFENGCISDICIENRNNAVDMCREAICRANIGTCATRIEL